MHARRSWPGRSVGNAAPVARRRGSGGGGGGGQGDTTLPSTPICTQSSCFDPRHYPPGLHCSCSCLNLMVVARQIAALIPPVQVALPSCGRPARSSERNSRLLAPAPSSQQRQQRAQERRQAQLDARVTRRPPPTSPLMAVRRPSMRDSPRCGRRAGGAPGEPAGTVSARRAHPLLLPAPLWAAGTTPRAGGSSPAAAAPPP